MRAVASLACSLVLLAAASDIARPSWPCDTGSNLPVCTAPRDQYLPVLAPDGSGGAILVWEDHRNGDFDIYAQRINADGLFLWPQDGIPICVASGEQRAAAVVADGAGGALIVWRDLRSGLYDLYCQHVDGAGAALWTVNGKVLTDAPLGQIDPVAVTDGAGGMIIAWGDGRNSDADLYAQRIDAAGERRWDSSGIPVSTSPGFQLDYTIALDGAGGAFVAWRDRQDGGTRNFVKAQHLDARGTTLWAVNGVALSETEGQYFPSIMADGSGGAIVAWQDSRSGATDEYGQITYDIYVQRLTASGAGSWVANGLALCTQPGYQNSPKLVADTSGAIVCWEDRRASSAISNIYAQRVLADGTIAWQVDGIPICAHRGSQQSPLIATDGQGGAIVTWFDGRTPANGFDIYAQRVPPRGVPTWGPDGVAVCTAPGNQFSPMLVSDERNGAFITWYDQRAGAEFDIYAHRLSPQTCDIPVPVLISSIEARALSDRIELAWYTAATIVAPLDVERRTGDETWRVIGVGMIHSDGRIEYQDRDVQPGRRYGYRLAITGGEVRETFGETWVETQSENGLALTSVRPNPILDEANIVLRVPSETRVRIAIFDGRGARTRELWYGMLAAGERALRWDGRDDSHRRVPPGTYFVRFEFRGRTLGRRIVVTR